MFPTRSSLWPIFYHSPRLFQLSPPISSYLSLLKLQLKRSFKVSRAQPSMIALIGWWLWFLLIWYESVFSSGFLRLLSTSEDEKVFDFVMFIAFSQINAGWVFVCWVWLVKNAAQIVSLLHTLFGLTVYYHILRYVWLAMYWDFSSAFFHIVLKSNIWFVFVFQAESCKF